MQAIIQRWPWLFLVALSEGKLSLVPASQQLSHLSTSSAPSPSPSSTPPSPLPTPPFFRIQLHRHLQRVNPPLGIRNLELRVHKLGKDDGNIHLQPLPPIAHLEMRRDGLSNGKNNAGHNCNFPSLCSKFKQRGLKSKTNKFEGRRVLVPRQLLQEIFLFCPTGLALRR